MYPACTITGKFSTAFTVYRAITKTKIPTTPRRLAPNASVNLAALIEVAEVAAAELAAELFVVAVALDADCPVVAVVAVADAADPSFVPACDVALIAPDSTALAACARPPNPE